MKIFINVINQSGNNYIRKIVFHYFCWNVSTAYQYCIAEFILTRKDGIDFVDKIIKRVSVGSIIKSTIEEQNRCCWYYRMPRAYSFARGFSYLSIRSLLDFYSIGCDLTF